MLDHIGWHSVLNWVVSQRGSAIVGSIQSQWVMATLGAMRRYRGRAVTLCSLRTGWRTTHFYSPEDAPYFAENCAQRFPACTKSLPPAGTDAVTPPSPLARAGHESA